MTRHASREALHEATAGVAGLAVVSGEIEAVVALESATEPGAADADRARLEKELAEAEGFLAAARARLTNEAFVEGARAREAELADQVERLRGRLAR
jgi:uncharacterized protein involved in exopolysaccharide biosynthesis